MNHDELIGAVAMSLYRNNVSQGKRATDLHDFDSNQGGHVCDDNPRRGLGCSKDDICYDTVNNPNWATEMPMMWAKVYMDQAMAKYGYEARERVLKELGDD